MPNTPTGVHLHRVAVVLHPGLDSGESANAAAIVAGGLRCDAFDEPVAGADGYPHVAVRWNVPILRSKTANQLKRLLAAAREGGVQAVAFTRLGQATSNSFGEYTSQVEARTLDELELIAVGLYGEDAKIRGLTKSFSVYR